MLEHKRVLREALRGDREAALSCLRWVLRTQDIALANRLLHEAFEREIPPELAEVVIKSGWRFVRLGFAKANDRSLRIEPLKR